MAKNQISQPGYTALWIIVIILAIFITMTHVVFLVGQGRWECVEYEKGDCYITCEMPNFDYTVEGDCNELSKMQCDGIVEMGVREGECLKEAWIRK